MKIFNCTIKEYIFYAMGNVLGICIILGIFFLEKNYFLLAGGILASMLFYDRRVMN